MLGDDGRGGKGKGHESHVTHGVILLEVILGYSLGEQQAPFVLKYSIYSGYTILSFQEENCALTITYLSLETTAKGKCVPYSTPKQCHPLLLPPYRG